MKLPPIYGTWVDIIVRGRTRDFRMDEMLRFIDNVRVREQKRYVNQELPPLVKAIAVELQHHYRKPTWRTRWHTFVHWLMRV